MSLVYLGCCLPLILTNTASEWSLHWLNTNILVNSVQNSWTLSGQTSEGASDPPPFCILSALVSFKSNVNGPILICNSICFLYSFSVVNAGCTKAKEEYDQRDLLLHSCRAYISFSTGWAETRYFERRGDDKVKWSLPSVGLRRFLELQFPKRSKALRTIAFVVPFIFDTVPLVYRVSHVKGDRKVKWWCSHSLSSQTFTVSDFLQHFCVQMFYKITITTNIYSLLLLISSTRTRLYHSTYTKVMIPFIN